jgi:hypothetical protein
MKIEKIITLANSAVRLRFLAMERSLRAVGCDLPLFVIPYDQGRFDLPKNALWWTTELHQWLQSEKAHPTMGKYQCLTTDNYQFIDSDVIFLKNPVERLNDQHGFITSCCHWNNPGHTFTSESRIILQNKTTCWPRNVFNTGQFACDHILYSAQELQSTCLDPRYINTVLRFPYHEQPGLVLLVNLSSVGIHNLTLPPTCMESTWAGDYLTENYKDYWCEESKMPYLIHWAGCDMSKPRIIDSLFTEYLTSSELKEWKDQLALKAKKQLSRRRTFLPQIKSVIKRFVKVK